MAPPQNSNGPRPIVLAIVAAFGLLATGVAVTVALRDEAPAPGPAASSPKAGMQSLSTTGSSAAGQTKRADDVPDTDAKSPQSSPADGNVAGLPDDARLRELIVGTWEDDYQGRRTMTLHADGSARMIVELSGLKATLFAERLEFDMQWSLADGVLTKRTTGGRPESKVNLILRTMGDSVSERVLEISEDRLLLLDPNGTQRYDWRRISADSPE